MPAGVTYWQKGTFRLYHHNPPLVRMVAALPVIWANPVTAPVYEQESWEIIGVSSFCGRLLVSVLFGRLLGRVDLGGCPVLFSLRTGQTPINSPNQNRGHRI